MKIWFCCTMFTNVEEDIKKSKEPNSISGHLFPKNIIRGFDENNVDINLVNIPRIRRYPDYPQILFRKNYFSHRCGSKDVNIGFINLFGINYITQIISEFIYLYKILKKRNKNVKNILLTFNTHLNHAIPMLLVKKIYKDIILCDIVGDLHNNYGMFNQTKGLKGKMINKMESYQDSLAKKFDCYSFVTQYMPNALNVEDKPSTIMECLYAPDSGYLPKIHNKQTVEKIIFNAGAIREEYGISHLLRAFSLIEDPSYRLWIAGCGDGVAEVKEYEKKDSRIKYLGFITPKQVEEYQQQATVLINPRTSEHEFVKYSFASKNMECLASGKPYIAHKLPCNPIEYDEYIQYPINETDEALKDKIIEVCEMSEQTKNEIATKSRNFILSEKNPQKQCEKIIRMLEGIGGQKC